MGITCYGSLCTILTWVYYFSLRFPPLFFSLTKGKESKMLYLISIFFITYLLTSFDIKRAWNIIKITFWRYIINCTDVLLGFFSLHSRKESIAFTTFQNNQWENTWEKWEIPCMKAWKGIKYLWVALTRNVHDLYEDNYITLLST